jgi:excisionase family DNA binding protein
MIGVSERTLRELMRQGELRYAKLDRAVLIMVSELHAFIERRTQKGGTQS